jgi:hypothetical protein
MTASNKVPEGMADTQESAILQAAVEAVVWSHVLDTDVPRKGQLVVIYPKEVSQLEAVLSAGDPNIDSADGHPIAHNSILQTCQLYENPPVFLSEEKARTVDDPFIAENVTEWMAATKQVATGSRRRVLENGEDKMSSTDEDDPNMKPDVLTGMYTEGMDPEKGQVKLSQSQIAAQKAAAQAPAAQSTPSRFSAPDTRLVPAVAAIGPTSKGDRGNPIEGCSPDLHASRLSTAPLGLPAPERQPTPLSSDTEDQANQTEDQKRCSRTGKEKAAAASQRAPAGSHPMATRTQEASRAGSLRSGGGSGKTDTCVAGGNPSKT